MIPALLKIRSMQLLRVIRDLGLIRVLIGFVILIVAVAGFINWVKADEGVEWAPLALVGLIFMIHQNRGDRTFFRLYASSANWVFQIEYLLLASPFVAVNLALGHWQLALGSVAACALIPFINLRGRSITLNSKLQRLIPDSALEWKSGVRKMLIPMTMIWLIGILGSYFMPAPIIAILLIGMMVSSFYEKMESLQILISEELNPQSFLFKKTLQSAAIFLAVCAPLIAAFGLFHQEQFYIVIIEFALLAMLLAYSVLLKYSYYLPHNDATGNQMLLAIGYMGILIPFVLPVFLYFLIRHYFKAKANLNLYLHDFN